MNSCHQTPIDTPRQAPAAAPTANKSSRKRKRRRRMTKGQANSAKDGLLCALLEDRKTLDDLTHEQDEEQLTTKTKAFVLSLNPNDGVWTGLEFGSDMHTERLTRAAVRVIKSMRAVKRRSTRGTATTDSVELAAATVSATFLDKSRSPTKPIILKRLSEMLSTTPTTFVKRSTIATAGAGLFARKRIKKGQVVAKFTGVLRNEPPDPNGRTIQLTSQSFLQCDNSAPTFANTARNLDGASSPQQRRNNARIAASSSSASLVAIATIEPGAEILTPYGRHF